MDAPMLGHTARVLSEGHVSEIEQPARRLVFRSPFENAFECRRRDLGSAWQVMGRSRGDGEEARFRCVVVDAVLLFTETQVRDRPRKLDLMDKIIVTEAHWPLIQESVVELGRALGISDAKKGARQSYALFTGIWLIAVGLEALGDEMLAREDGLGRDVVGEHRQQFGSAVGIRKDRSRMGTTAGQPARGQYRGKDERCCSRGHHPVDLLSGGSGEDHTGGEYVAQGRFGRITGSRARRSIAVHETVLAAILRGEALKKR